MTIFQFCVFIFFLYIRYEPVKREEIIEVLRNRVPGGVILTPYGNENSNRSLIKPPSFTKANVEANADTFDLQRLDEAVVEIPTFSERTRNINKIFIHIRGSICWNGRKM